MNDVSSRSSVLTILVVCGMLGGCSREGTPAAHTVHWYLAHPADRATTVERCANDPGTLEDTPDCINAVAATQQADIGSLRSLPPLGLASRPANQRAATRPSSGPSAQ